MRGRLATLLRRLMPLVIVGIAMWTYLTYGLQREIARDDALYAHCGQRVVDGFAPYDRVFDVKGPFSSMVATPGVIAAQHLGVPEYRAVQFEFIIIAILSVLAVYLLTHALTDSITASTFAAVTFLGFQGFLQHAAGSRPKSFVLLLMVLALVAMVRRRWALGGALVAAAALTWQAMVLLGLAGLAAIRGRERRRRLRATLAFVGAGLALLGLVVAWTATRGGLVDLWHGSVLSLTYIGHRAVAMTPGMRVWRPLRECHEGYPSSFVAGLLGVLGLLAALSSCMREHDGLLGALTRSRWSTVFVGFAVLMAFSVADFQGYADVYVLLPFAAIGLGYLLWRALEALTGPDQLVRPRHRTLAAALVALVLLAPTVVFVKFHPGRGLDEQKRITAEIIQRLDGRPIQCMNAPQVLYLGELNNVTRHVVLTPGLLRYVEAEEPGGIDGWLRSIEEADTGIIVCYVRNCLEMPAVYNWVKDNYQLWRVYDEWEVYERTD